MMRIESKDALTLAAFIRSALVAIDRIQSDVSQLNLNTQYTHSQIAGYALASRSSLNTESARIVQVRVNNVNNVGVDLPESNQRPRPLAVVRAQGQKKSPAVFFDGGPAVMFGEAKVQTFAAIDQTVSAAACAESMDKPRNSL